jgi:hypothetical protein
VPDVFTITRLDSVSRRAVVRTGARLAYAAPLVAATYPLTPLRADAKQKQDLISVDAADVAASAATSNLLPVADAGPNQPVTDADGDGVESVTLDGSGSSDPDGTIVAYEWTLDDQWLSSDPVATVVLPVGKHSVYLTVTDDAGATDRDRVWVRIDAAPPPTPQPPAAPSNAAAAQRRDLVSVTWQDESADETGFRVYRSDDGGATWGAVGETSADRRSLRDSGVAAGGSYAYAVAAFNDAGESAWSNVAWITLEAPAAPAQSAQDTGGQEQPAGDAQTGGQGGGDQAPPAPQVPASPTQLVAKEKQASVDLRWRDDAGDAAGFRVYRTDDGGTTWNPIFELGPTKTTYRDGNVAPGATYAYVVAAFNDAGESTWPDAVRITLAAPAAQAQDAGGQEQAAPTAPEDGAGAGGDQGGNDTAPAGDQQSTDQGEGG